MTTENHKLWGGRFEAGLEKWVEEFGASISFDQKMAEFDLKGSIAHVTMLGETGIIAKEEANQIKAGLEELLEEYKAGKIEFDVSNEDIHMNMESLLTAKIGPVAGKLHTARSRNDQVATDMHLYLKAKLDEVIAKLANLRKTLVDLADEHVYTIMPGYTHLQHAQPISFGHHLMAYYNMFTRDSERFEFNIKHADMSPLGAAALAGTTFPIDREMTAELMGFAKPYSNSLDVDGDEYVNLQKQAYIERIGAECKAEDMPFFLEILTYDENITDNTSAAFAKVKPHKVNEAMKVFSDERFGIDVLKVEVPVNMKYVEGFADGEVVYTKEEAAKAFKDQEAASHLPYIYLSAGVSAKLFQETLVFAAESGAKFNGVLCGRATWAGSVQVYIEEGEAAAREWLRTQGRKNIEELNAVLIKTASSWSEKVVEPVFA
jgi:hypothetical protein